MLRILRAIPFLALLMEQVPGRMAAEREKFESLHAGAVAEALAELESCAASRVRRSGANEDRTTGNLAIAVYHHDTSRELDPQLHTHAVAANLTYDGKEGRWKALQASGNLRAAAYLTEVYRNSLARQVRLLGYEIENRRDGRGSDCGFEIAISGAAGTGKTAALREINRGLTDGGREVLAVAPTTSAVEELKKVGFSDAITLERLLQDASMRAAIHGKVVILDEAGMVSGRQMYNLLRIARQESARIVFSGDTKQIRSVEAGDALRVLEQESRLKTVSSTQVRPQTEPGYREAIQEFRRDPGRGFDKLETIGAVREVAFTERAQAIAQAYADSTAQGRNTLVVCATHDEIERVTEAIRASRKRAGDLGDGTAAGRDVSLNWTAARKRNLQNLRTGQVLGFHRKLQDIARNDEKFSEICSQLFPKSGTGIEKRLSSADFPQAPHACR